MDARRTAARVRARRRGRQRGVVVIAADVPQVSVEAEAAGAVARVLAELAGCGSPHGLARRGEAAGPDERSLGCPRGVVVDSPPGAGKSTLVVRAAVDLATAVEPVMVVAQTNGQIDDLVDRLVLAVPGLAVGRLSAQDYMPTPRIACRRAGAMHPAALPVSGARAPAVCREGDGAAGGAWSRCGRHSGRRGGHRPERGGPDHRGGAVAVCGAAGGAL